MEQKPSMDSPVHSVWAPVAESFTSSGNREVNLMDSNMVVNNKDQTSNHYLSSSSSISDAAFLMELNAITSTLPLYSVSIQGQDYKVMIDSGATDNYASSRLMAVAQSSQVVANRSVETAGGEIITIDKKIQLLASFDGLSAMVEAYVFDSKFDLILGRSWLNTMNPTPNWQTDEWQLRDKAGGIHFLRPLNGKQSTPQVNYLISGKQLARLMKTTTASEPLECFLVHWKDPSINTISPLDADWQALLHEFGEVFRDNLPGLPPPRDVQHVINTGDAAPVNRPPFKMSPLELDELRKQLNELTGLGLIQPSSSPWGAPVLFVKKKNGEMRMCIDYRALNKVTIRNAHPLPRIDECLDRLHGASYFTSLDLKSGYHQVRIQADDMPKTAFNTRYGQFEFRVLPFGLTNAPPTFQKLMNGVLCSYLDDFALVYLDGILIFSRTADEHRQHVRLVLERLREANLIVNIKKCEFNRRELTFVGFKISADGILPADDKVLAIRDWPIPTNVQEVRQFFGLAQHYRRFMPGFAGIAAPITDLTRGVGPKRRSIVWTADCQVSFEKIKSMLCTAPILLTPDMTKPFRIETDASDFGIGAVLLQENVHGVWCPLAFESKKLSSAEQSYPAQERELLAILHALRTWRCLIEGQDFVVFTDHLPLRYFRTQTKPTNRLIRWMAEIEAFDPDIQYKPGKDNDVADILSRRMDVDLVPGGVMEPTLLYSIAPGVDLTDWPGFYGVDRQLWPASAVPILDRNQHHFVVKDGTVFRKVASTDDDTWTEVPFIPFSARADFVAGIHASCGHLGSDSILSLLHTRVWWPRMKVDIKNWLKSCPECQLLQRRSTAHRGVMHPLDIPAAFHRWHLDFIGELPVSLKGNKWILVAVDYATNWPIARAVKTANAETVADFIYEEIVMRFGCPKEILTDRGANFLSKLVAQYLGRLQVYHKMTSAFHPRTNGKCERLNGTLKNMIKKYAKGALHRWDDFLNPALFACRIRKHATTGRSPFYSTYGREPIIPGDTFQPYLDHHTMADPRTTEELNCKQLDQLGQHREAAANRMKLVSQQDKQRWDSAIKPLHFNIGDKVLLTHEGRYGLEPLFKGPYTVTKATDVDTYLLECMNGQPFAGYVHVDRLLPAFGTDITTTWYDPTTARREWRQATAEPVRIDPVDKLATTATPTEQGRSSVSGGDNVGA
ncbi:hypothetical protein [Absidia glauca]|uniref:RNA-directed DNA polymerase n=1 Tax=Absidia glauca TaxID=4829 RepID=A0A163KUW3_ABSGL|nr:hypothetical protein [Absidia glauca]